MNYFNQLRIGEMATAALGSFLPIFGKVAVSNRRSILRCVPGPQPDLRLTSGEAEFAWSKLGLRKFCRTCSMAWQRTSYALFLFGNWLEKPASSPLRRCAECRKSQQIQYNYL
ncbi:hypothetical protein [Paracoccus sp. S1E-3]|uniref:hypothetical protein n=1 Tax=Paracoccus sp. S1E-3 TaxID=2756130 RepID=UPI0015EF8E67|nr:hypothetical protein [Paracoccus sp. S1E-3]MBA4489199.1 hypothetical protein [Paracoccus sp. S1E-3]